LKTFEEWWKQTYEGNERYANYVSLQGYPKRAWHSATAQSAAEIAALRSELERLKAENEGMRKALAGVPDPAAFMAAVDALLSLPNVDNRISMWTAEIEAFQLLRATRGKRP